MAGGQQGCVELIAQEDFAYALAAEETPQVVIPGPGFVFAPVTEGANAGFAYVCLGEKSVGKIPVVYGQTVELPEEPPKQHFWDGWWKGEAS